MIFVTNDELREKVDMDKFTVELVKEVFDLLSDGKPHYIFTNIDEYEEACIKYAVGQGWDPDTTLASFEMPLTEEERALQVAATAKAIEEDPDWDDIQIGVVNPKQIVCCLYPNTSYDKYIGTFKSVANLKAFL